MIHTKIFHPHALLKYNKLRATRGYNLTNLVSKFYLKATSGCDLTTEPQTLEAELPLS